MKKAFLFLFLFVSVNTFAQQDPYYTHFKDVIQAYNPAAAGHAYGEICITGLTHHQWRQYTDDTRVRGTNAEPGIGLTNVAPVTYNMNVNSVFKLNANQFIGAGLTVINDQLGSTVSTGFMANLNFKQQIQGGYSELSGGFGIGIRQWGWDNPNFLAKDIGDPFVPQLSASESKLNMNLGVMYKTQRLGSSPLKNFYTGLSVTNVTQPLYDVPAGVNGQSIFHLFVPHYYLIAGSDVELSGGTVLEPAMLLKYGLLNGAYKPQVDLNVTALFSGAFRGGLAFRQWGNMDAVSVLMGYQAGKIKVGYSYDVTVSNIQRVSNGTHEIFVRYCIPINYATDETIIKESVRFL